MPTAGLAHPAETRVELSLARRAVIVAPGPSATNGDLETIGATHDVDAIALSGLFLMPMYSQLRARAHVLAASHPPITTAQWSAWFARLMETGGDTNIFVPHVDRALVATTPHANDSRLCFYRSVSRSVHARLPKTLRQRPRVALGGQSVSTIALSLAIAQGYQEIGLYGIDHDWILNVGRTRHAYEESDNPLVQNGYSEWSNDVLFDHECRSYVNLWADYRLLRAQADAAGVRIVNTSRQSLLDVFPRVALEEFLSPTLQPSPIASGTHR